MHAEMKFEANLTDDAVKATQKDIKKKRARNYSEKTKAKKGLADQRKKQQKVTSIEDILGLPEIEDEFPSVLELTIVDRVHAREEEKERRSREGW
ncbi:expressed unknown protein [Seminavis robusta]|uniref:Uncharacterized protein n=1 Tax=Seminavis robusta TaxID=568900 RepID=A0A9N8EZH6_9STRA|nr:expressed unknown protein [Seminavis robusta]|eukprot:Sro2260_g321140.1 n/a (95) ;mRNA; r:8287-8571